MIVKNYWENRDLSLNKKGLVNANESFKKVRYYLFLE